MILDLGPLKRRELQCFESWSWI